MHPISSNLQRRAITTTTVLLLSAVLCLLFAGMTGSVPVALSDMPAAALEVLRGQPSSMAATLLNLRLERALIAFVTGASLSLAGVMMQALLRNPLADP